VKEYYDRRAPEYDDWYGGVYYEGEQRERFRAEVVRLEHVIAGLEPVRTLDVACGTGFLTRRLRGTITGLDQSPRMLGIAAEAAPEATFVRGDALALPFADDAFERVLSGHFYGHLDEAQRTTFLREARRVAPELLIVDASVARSDVAERWSVRSLQDGSTWEVFKRFFTPEGLLAELGGGDVLFGGTWFVAVRSTR
jgi:ubiquinone/menaquinone biosynthesis C-methylase UbiE